MGGEGGERGASKNELEAFSCTFCPSAGVLNIRKAKKRIAPV